MEKLSQLLDDVTILNFGLLFKLARRYILHFVVAIFVFFTLYFKYFYTQPIIFSANMQVKAVAKHSLAVDQISLTQTESTAGVNIGELSATLSSYAFIKSFATLVYKDKSYLEMNFGSIATGKALRGREIEANCAKKKDCIIESLTGSLGSLFTLDQGLTEDRFNLTVNALEKDTAIQLANILTKAIDRNRIETRRYLVGKEIESVSHLIAESRSYLKGQNAFQKIEEEDKKSFVFNDLKDRMHIIQTSLSNEITNSSAIEARLSESNKLLQDPNGQSDGLEKAKNRELVKKITDIRHNIAAINNIREENRSESDKQILAGLQAELTLLEGQHSSKDSLRVAALKDTFSDDQRIKENDIKFESQVSKNKVKNLKAEYETIAAQINLFQKDKTSREAIVSKMKSEVDFLKNLESKQLSLKIMNSTLTSDLHFEDFSNDASSFRRSSSLKIWLFSFCFTMVFYIFSIVLRFAIDDRIYTEHDLVPYLKDLKFFGEVPVFE